MATFCAVPTKKTNEIDMVKPMRKFIENTYTNIKQEDYQNALTEFNKLRNLVIQKSLDKHESSLDVLYRYYDQISEIEKKLPVSAHQIPINFKWRDAFDVDSFLSSKRTLAMMSSGYEKMCVMFNVAAVQSQVAAAQNHSSEEGRKVAAKYFQMSSGIFCEMRDIVLGHIQQDPTPDLSTDCLIALSTLMLAQAQETIFLKATADKMKEGSIAKLAYQCSEHYAETLKLMQISTVAQIWPRDWLNIVAMKQAAMHSLAQYNQSVVAQNEKAYGEEIARLKNADNLMKISYNHCMTSFAYKHDQGRIQHALQKAVKDNDFIYHDKVPDIADLAQIGKLPVAKSIPASKPMSSSFSDLFVKLVPLEVHYALTAFDNRKSTVTSMEVGRMREATQLMNSILASMNLPAALEDVTGSSLPESLLDKATKVTEGGGIQAVDRLITDIPTLLARNREILDDAFKQLTDEEQSDSQLRGQFGDRWKRTPSATLTAPMNEEGNKYRTILNQAVTADKLVNDKYQAHRGVIEILSKPRAEIEQAIPSANPASSLQNTTVVTDLKRMMTEVDAIRAEREATEAELNDATFNMSSVFTAALASDGAIDEERISAEELNKVYTSLRERISQSIQKQESLLANVQKTNNEFANMKQSNNAAVSRETALKDLAAGYDMFMELNKNLTEGTKFYNDLTPLLVKFQSKVSDFCFARKTEKEELLADLNKTIANQPGSNPPPAPNYQSPGETKPAPSRPPPPNVSTTAQSHAPAKPVAAPRTRVNPSVPQGVTAPTNTPSSANTDIAGSAAMRMSTPQQVQPTAPGSAPYPASPPVPMPMPPAAYNHNPYMGYNQPNITPWATQGVPSYFNQLPYPQQPPQYPQQPHPYPQEQRYPQQSYPQQPYPQQPYHQQPYPQQPQFPNYGSQQWR